MEERVSYAEAARRLGRSVDWVRRAVRDGRLEVVVVTGEGYRKRLVILRGDQVGSGPAHSGDLVDQLRRENTHLTELLDAERARVDHLLSIIAAGIQDAPNPRPRVRKAG